MKYLRGINRGLRDYRWLSFYIQRELTLDPKRREQISALIAHVLPKSQPFQPSDAARAIAGQLDENGVVAMPDLLTSAQVGDMLAYLQTKTCRDPRHPEMAGFQDPADAHDDCFHAYYSDEDVVNTPHLLAIANHPVILEAIELRFGCKPTLASIFAWWLLKSYNYSDSEADYFCWNANSLHRDVDDWAQIKLFIYLTDVDDQAAPHMFLQGSHRGGFGFGKKNLPLEDARKSCPEKIKTITGPAGTAWLENAFGLHVGTLPISDNRLAIAIGYSLLPQPYTTAPRTSLSDLEPRRFDPYVNRLWIDENGANPDNQSKIN